jgi:hypothetical protein
MTAQGSVMGGMKIRYVAYTRDWSSNERILDLPFFGEISPLFGLGRWRFLRERRKGRLREGRDG